MISRTTLGLLLAMQIGLGQIPEVGMAHPDFLLPDLEGTPGRLSDHRGKRVLLFYFASW